MRLLRSAALVALAASSCVSFETTECADGRVCESGRVCDEAHASCVLPEQFEECQGLENGTPCIAAGSFGSCDLGVCILDECGNGILERGETCDLQPATTCVDQGFGFGRMQCTAECTHEPSLCGDIGFELRRPPGLVLTVSTDVYQEGQEFFLSFARGFFNSGLVAYFDGSVWKRYTPREGQTDGDGNPLPVPDVNALDGPGASDLFAVGQHGLVARFDGTEWEELDPGFSDVELETVSVHENEVLVGGASELFIQNRLSGDWVQQQLPDLGGAEVVASTFWDNDPYVLVYDEQSATSRVLWRSGTQWELSGPMAEKFSRLDASLGELAIVGEDSLGAGLLLLTTQADLGDLRRVSVPGASGAAFTSVALSESGQLVVGTAEGIVHERQEGWVSYEVASGANLEALHLRESGFVALSEGLIFSSERAIRSTKLTQAPVSSISALTRDRAAVVSNSRVLVGGLNSAVEFPLPADTSALRTVYMPDGRVYAAGKRNESGWVGLVQTSAGPTAWTELAGLPANSGQILSLAVAPNHEVWVSDLRSLWRWRDGAWQDMQVPASPVCDSLITSVSVNVERAFIVLTPDILPRDEGQAPPTPCPEFEVLEWTGTEWRSFLRSSDSESFQAVAVLGEHVFVTGQRLRVWNGSEWRVDDIPFPDADTASQLVVRSPSDAFASTFFGELMHFDGDRWSPVERADVVSVQLDFAGEDLVLAGISGLTLLRRFDSWESP